MLQYNDRIDGQAGLTILPNEMWARVFAHLQPGFRESTAFYHVRFHALRTVCSQFCKVFDENPQLSRHLCVPDHEDTDVPKYGVSWFKENSHIFETFESHATSPQQVFLKALMLPDSQLTKIYLEAFCQDTLGLLLHFKKLAYCHLNSAWVGTCDLSPLQQLACLTRLSLSGGERFSNLNKLSHLTSLELDGANVGHIEDSAYRSAATLQELCVLHSDLDGFTLQDCHNLEVLQCLGARISSQREGSTLDIYCSESVTPIRLPAVVSTLTRLTNIEMNCANSKHEQIDCDWFSQLTALQDLSFGCCTCSQPLLVGESLTNLSCLTSFEISSTGPIAWIIEEAPLPTVRFSLDWSRLPSLAYFGITRIQVDIDDRFLSLVQLAQVQMVAIGDCNPATPQATVHFVRLLSACATKYPNILQYVVEGSDMLGRLF